MDADTRIYGYTDGMGVHPQEDDVTLCPSCGTKYFEANPNEWRILRTRDRGPFIWHKCDDCQKMIFPVMAEGKTVPEGNADPRLEVYAKFLETLDF